MRWRLAQWRWTDRRLAVGIGLFALVRSLVWIAMMPVFKIADEPSHFENVQYRAEHLKAPRFDGGPMGKVMHSGAAPEVLLAWQLSNFYFRGQYMKDTRQALEEQKLDDMADNPVNRHGDGQITSMAYPGAYYDLGVVAYDLFRKSSVVTRVFAVRIVSALLGVLAAVATFFAARRVMDSRALALAAALIVILEPMEAQMTAAVNNDAGIIGFAALVFYLQIRFLVETPRIPAWWLGLLLGLTTTLAVLSKPHGFATGPGSVIVCGLIVARNLRSREAWRFALAAALPILVVALPSQWLTVHEGTRILPAPVEVAAGAAAQLRPDFSAFLSTLDDSYALYLLKSTIGQFGWLEYSLGIGWIDYVKSVANLAWYGFIAAVAARLLWPDESRWLSMRALLFCAFTVGFAVLFILYAEYRFRLAGMQGVIQGRSFLFSLPAAAILLCACWGALVPSRFRTLSATALIMCAVALHVASILVIVRYHYGS